jgi:hypothetical protein
MNDEVVLTIQDRHGLVVNRACCTQDCGMLRGGCETALTEVDGI